MQATMRPWSTVAFVTSLLVCGADQAIAQDGGWDRLIRQAEELSRRRRYDDAARFAEDALEAARKTFGPDDDATARSLELLATIRKGQSHLTEAASRCADALAIRENVLGPDHPAALATRQLLAEIYLLQGRLEQARPMADRVLEVQEGVLGAEHPKLIAPMLLVAKIAVLQGQPAVAEPLYRSTRDLVETWLGSEDALLADALMILGNIHLMFTGGVLCAGQAAWAGRVERQASLDHPGAHRGAGVPRAGRHAQLCGQEPGAPAASEAGRAAGQARAGDSREGLGPQRPARRRQPGAAG